MADWTDWAVTAKNIALAGLRQARDLGESAKLSLDNLSEEENRRRVFAAVGRRFVEEHESPPQGYEALYQQLEESEKRMQANKARLEQRKQ